jgi:hypothetical protein
MGDGKAAIFLLEKFRFLKPEEQWKWSLTSDDKFAAGDLCENDRIGHWVVTPED